MLPHRQYMIHILLIVADLPAVRFLMPPPRDARVQNGSPHVNRASGRENGTSRSIPIWNTLTTISIDGRLVRIDGIRFHIR